jgi:wzy
MLIYVLFVLTIIILCFTYSVKKDIFHPTCLISLSFCFSIFCAILNVENWKINLSSLTVEIIIIGLLSFILPSLFIKVKKDKKMELNELKEIKISKGFTFIFLMAQFLLLVLHITWMEKYMGGFSNLFDLSLMKKFRFEKSFDQTIDYPFYINQGIKFSKALVYILTYVFINNAIFKCTKKKKIKIEFSVVLSILMFVIQTFVTGGRSELILFLIYFVSLYFYLYNFYNEKNGTRIGKNLIKIVLVVILVLYLFSITRTLVGRTSNDGFISYISRYFGGSIQLLDQYLKYPVPKSSIFGKETFYGINKFLGQLGLINEKYTIHLEFRSSNGIELGNVYTAFRRMYQDFGIFGIIILNVIHGTIMSCCYKKIYSSDKVRLSLGVIFYFMLLHTIILMPFSDFFYSTVLSINYLNIIFYMIIIMFVLKKYELKLRR